MPHRSHFFFLATLPLLLLVTACGERGASGDSGATEGADPTTLSYAAELGVDFSQMQTTANGVYYLDTVVGEGEPAESGRGALVHYTGYFPDGRSFDSSLTFDEPFPVRLGMGQVIPGWDEGVPGMRVGGRRLLVIPPAMAYGAAGAGNVIPPHQVLVFEVELLEVF
jgi:FKBP-type peptidyl-prolyl cis-trans isomerase FkpA